MTDIENTSAEVENQNHRYLGNDIPWYVRLIWIGFWVFVVYYTLAYLFPAVQRELFSGMGGGPGV
ncbi:MAG: hypothetical protein U0795_15235 [Pirellulales bacterium]